MYIRIVLIYQGYFSWSDELIHFKFPCSDFRHKIRPKMNTRTICMLVFSSSKVGQQYTFNSEYPSSKCNNYEPRYSLVCSKYFNSVGLQKLVISFFGSLSPSLKQKLDMNRLFDIITHKAHAYMKRHLVALSPQVPVVKL